MVRHARLHGAEQLALPNIVNCEPDAQFVWVHCTKCNGALFAALNGSWRRAAPESTAEVTCRNILAISKVYVRSLDLPLNTLNDGRRLLCRECLGFVGRVKPSREREGFSSKYIALCGLLVYTEEKGVYYRLKMRNLGPTH